MLLIAFGLEIVPLTLAHADTVDDYIRGQVASRHMPGVSVAIVREGKLVKAAGYGFANVETRTKATSDSLYVIASMTKSFTVIATLKLADDGKLSLDDPISKYVADTPAAWQSITVRHLMRHTSGIKNLPELPDWDTIVRSDDTPEEIIKRAGAIPLDFVPGSQFHYSNTGYTVLAAIIQKATGKSYEEVLRDRVLTPIQMTATRMDSRSEVIPQRAPGYYGSRSKGTLFNAEYYSPQQYLGSGCLLSSVRDLARWDIALRNGKIFPDTKPQPYTAKMFDFGWGKTGTKDHRTVWTGGGLYGHTCSMIRFVDDDLTVIVLTNFGDGAPDVMARHIAGLYVPVLANVSNEITGK